MADLFQDMDFSGHSLDISHVDDFTFLQDFDGYLLSGDWVDGEFDLAEGAFSQIFSDDIVSDGPALLKGRLRFLHADR